MTHAAARALALVLIVGCDSASHQAADAGAGAGGAGESGSGGMGAGGSGGMGASGSGGMGASGRGGTGASGSGGMGASGSGGMGASGSGGMSATGGGGIGAGGAVVVTTGTGGGTFVMCDDHADFNGRGLCSPTGKYGAVVATQTLSASGAVTTLTAFFAASKPATDPGCTAEAAGTGCTAVTCPRGAKNAGGPEAGAITAKSNGGMIVTKADATGAYDVAGFAATLWSMPKAALTFSAAGGGVPAFGDTFCGPASPTITMPAAAPGAGLTIDRASDLALQWTGATVGDVEVLFRDDSGAASTVEVRCFFTGAAGQGTVPTAALAKIGAGAHTVASYVWVRKISGSGGTCVELTGVNTSVSAAGGPFFGPATFQ
jgi:hypothetical protein